MSRPQFHVATSLSFSSSGFGVATTVLGCDHLSVYRMTSCCDFDFLVAIVLVVFCLSRFQFNVATSFAVHFFYSGRNFSSLLQLIFLLTTFISGCDLKVMSRPLFLLLSSSSGRDLSEWSRHRLWSLINKWLQLQSSCWDSSSRFYVVTSTLCLDLNWCLSFKN